MWTIALYHVLRLRPSANEGWVESWFLWKRDRRITGLLLGFMESGLDPSLSRFVDMNQCFPFLDPRRLSLLEVFTGDLKWDRSAVMAETLSTLKRGDILGLLDSAIMASDETKRVSDRLPLRAIMGIVKGHNGVASIPFHCDIYCV